MIPIKPRCEIHNVNNFLDDPNFIGDYKNLSILLSCGEKERSP